MSASLQVTRAGLLVVRSTLRRELDFAKEDGLAKGSEKLYLQLLDALTMHLELALKRRRVTAMHVHEARKTVKKLRALFRLMRSALGESLFRSLNTCFRNVGRALAAARDAEALVEATHALFVNEADAVPVPKIPKRLRKIVSLLEARAVQQADPETLQKAVSEAKKVLASQAPHGWPLLSHAEATDVVEAGLVAMLDDARTRFQHVETLRQMATSHESVVDEAMHELRKRIKDMAYQSEMLLWGWPEMLLPSIDSLKLLADLLGNEHDLAMLLQALDSKTLADDLGAQKAALAAVATARKKWLHTQSIALSKRICVEQPASFAARMLIGWRTEVLPLKV